MPYSITVCMINDPTFFLSAEMRNNNVACC